MRYYPFLNFFMRISMNLLTFLILSFTTLKLVAKIEI